MKADEFMHTLHPEKKKRHTASFMAGLVVGLFIVAAIFFISTGGGLTGQIVWEPTNYNETQEVALNYTNITKLTVTGSLRGGAGEVLLYTESGVLTVYSGDATPPRIWTEKTNYAQGETITIVVDANDYALWLTNSAGNKTPINETITPEPGSYELAALINDSGASKETIMVTVRDDTNTSLDTPRTPVVKTFTDYCDETCVLSPSQEYLLVINPGQGAELNIEDVQVTEEANAAPIVVAAIPEQELMVGETIRINLNGYFMDDETLVYDINNMLGLAEDIDGGLLTLTANVPGTYSAIVYASDLEYLVQNAFTITVLEADNATNITVNTTNITATQENTTISVSNTTIIPLQNETETIIVPTNNTVSNVSADCSNPDPNARPLECLQNDTERYFPDQSIIITNNKRAPVARITPVGNLMLTGDYYENSAINAPSSDYTIGYRDEYNTYMPTIWFETSSGHLYVSGRVIEENSNLQPAKGSYVLRNDRGVVLAWANTRAGDLYVRGNVIPYRRSLE